MQTLFSKAPLFLGGKTSSEILKRLSLMSHWPELGHVLIHWPITSKEKEWPWLTWMMEVYLLGRCTLLPDKGRVPWARRGGIALSVCPTRICTNVNRNAPAKMLRLGSSSYLLTEDAISEANVPCRCVFRLSPAPFSPLLALALGTVTQRRVLCWARMKIFPSWDEVYWCLQEKISQMSHLKM